MNALLAAGAQPNARNKARMQIVRAAVPRCAECGAVQAANGTAGGSTPLHSAAVYANTDCVTALLASGADAHATDDVRRALRPVDDV
jgi:hypothetical protein